MPCHTRQYLQWFCLGCDTLFRYPLGRSLHPLTNKPSLDDQHLSGTRRHFSRLSVVISAFLRESIFTILVKGTRLRQAITPLRSVILTRLLMAGANDSFLTRFADRFGRGLSSGILAGHPSHPLTDKSSSVFLINSPSSGRIFHLSHLFDGTEHSRLTYSTHGYLWRIT